jgi:hypothetical protein
LKIILGVIGALVLLAALWYTEHLRAENQALRDQIAKYESAAAAASPSSVPNPEVPGAGNRPRVLHEEARDTLIATLSVSSGKKVWFVRQANDPEADLFQRELEDTFLESGWEIASSSESARSLRSGIRVFVADDVLPDHVSDAVSGLRAAGFDVLPEPVTEPSTRNRKRRIRSSRESSWPPSRTS